MIKRMQQQQQHLFFFFYGTSTHHLLELFKKLTKQHWMGIYAQEQLLSAFRNDMFVVDCK